jgi:Fe2+ or Zn2+ uptake regulation protein
MTTETPANKRVRVQIDLTPSRHAKLKALAESEGRTIQSYCIYHLLLKGNIGLDQDQDQQTGE